jgi:hypothetical protein
VRCRGVDPGGPVVAPLPPEGETSGMIVLGWKQSLPLSTQS